jgi:hypothetical protein
LVESGRCRSSPYLLYRNPDLTPADFVRHYREIHSVLSVEAIPLQTYYAVNLADEADHPLSNNVRVAPPPSAVAFLRFDDLGVLADPSRLYATTEFEERLTADGAYLFAAMHGYVVDEVVRWGVERTWPLGQPSPGVNRISLVCKRPELTDVEFRERYEHLYDPLVQAHDPELWRCVQNYVVSAVTPQAPPLDALAELHIARDPASGGQVDNTTTSVVDPSASLSVATRETVWIA